MRGHNGGQVPCLLAVPAERAAPRLLSTALRPRDSQSPTGSVFSVGISLRDFLPEDYVNSHNS